MKKLVVLLAFLSFACTGGDDVDGIACTEEARAGLMVTVKDAATGTMLTDGVTVTATAGDYTEELEIVTDDNRFVGAWERPGDYILTVTATGYQGYTSGTITVGADVCHVIGENVTVELQPE